MQRRPTIGLCTVLVTVITLLAAASATERSTGELQFHHAKIKTVTASTPPAVLTLPTCPTRVDVFSHTAFTCPAAATVCTIEATVTSEVSDVTPGADSIRFSLIVDGAATGVFPTANFGVHSTAKTGQIESATASWMRNAVTPGDHILAGKECVADTTGGGGATAFAGDRILTMRLSREN